MFLRVADYFLDMHQHTLFRVLTFKFWYYFEFCALDFEFMPAPLHVR